MDRDRLEAGAVAASWAPIPDDLGVVAFMGRLTEALTEVCDCAMSRTALTGRLNRPIYWWNDAIASLRRKCVRARRSLWRRRERAPPEELADLWAGLKRARRDLRKEIGRAKRRAWRELLDTLEADPWGRPYQIVLRRATAPVAPICEVLAPESLDRIVEELFPSSLGEARTGLPEVAWDPAWDVIMDEIIRAVKRLGAGKKAPDADGIPGCVLTGTAGLLGPEWARGFTRCMREAVIPPSWKTARLVLLKKKDKPEGEPSSYQPICLLDELGKLFERVVVERLREYVDEVGGIFDDQYVFRRGRSTVDAILRVRDTVVEGTRRGNGVGGRLSLDIANAFNSPGPRLGRRWATRGFSST